MKDISRWGRGTWLAATVPTQGCPRSTGRQWTILDTGRFSGFLVLNKGSSRWDIKMADGENGCIPFEAWAQRLGRCSVRSDNPDVGRSFSAGCAPLLRDKDL